jgi:geranylgeranyl pyrophosphate synthase
MEVEMVENGLKAVEQELRAAVNSDVNTLYDAGHHIIDSGGKRLRPRVALLAHLAAGGQALDQMIPLASAIELVHTATLVHDDINDHSLTRRGKITVHARWGRTFALLTGDYLFTKVYEMMAPYGPQYNVVMADACVKLVEGETLQALAAKAGTMDRETYKQIIARKTASLFEAGARMGAMLAGADEAVVTALATYGYNLGLAFQIVDDILDIVGDPEKLGKPVGLDVTQGMGLMMAQNGRKVLGETATMTAEVEVDPIQEMLLQLRESGAVEVARLQAYEVAQRALAALADVPPSPARDELEGVVNLVIERQK